MNNIVIKNIEIKDIEKWIEFHGTTNVIDENTIENRRFNLLKNHNREEFYDFMNTHENFLYGIFNNDKLLASMIWDPAYYNYLDNDFKVNEENYWIPHFECLNFNPDSDWIEIMNIIINFFFKKNEKTIEFSSLMGHHPYFQNIIKNYGGESINCQKRDTHVINIENRYIIHLFKIQTEDIYNQNLSLWLNLPDESIIKHETKINIISQKQKIKVDPQIYRSTKNLLKILDKFIETNYLLLDEKSWDNLLLDEKSWDRNTFVTYCQFEKDFENYLNDFTTYNISKYGFKSIIKKEIINRFGAFKNYKKNSRIINKIVNNIDKGKNKVYLCNYKYTQKIIEFDNPIVLPFNYDICSHAVIKSDRDIYFDFILDYRKLKYKYDNDEFKRFNKLNFEIKKSIHLEVIYGIKFIDTIYFTNNYRNTSIECIKQKNAFFMNIHDEILNFSFWMNHQNFIYKFDKTKYKPNILKNKNIIIPNQIIDETLKYIKYIFIEDKDKGDSKKFKEEKNKEEKYEDDKEQFGYIYLIQPEEYVISNLDIYKIGMSSKKDLNRIKSYGKGSKLVNFHQSKKFKILEKKILKKIKDEPNIKLVKGQEYFQGDLKLIQNIFFKIIEKDIEEAI